MALLSVTEYAEKHHKDSGNVRRMLLCGRLEGHKIGNQWVIDENAIYPKDNRVKSGKYKIYALDELIQIIKPILNKYNADSATLFGSYARNEASNTSDIDLLVRGGSNFDPTDIFSIADELNKASGKNVDVYEQREISKTSELMKSIDREGVIIA